MIRICFLVVVMMSFLGCASPQVVSSQPKSATINSSFDAVWEKAVRFVSTNQINIETIEKDSGLIVIGAQSIDAQTLKGLCDAKAPFLYTLKHGSGKGNITVVEEGGFVTATINLSFFANSNYGYQTASNPCASTGKYEESFLNALK